ncbi:four-domain proteases inhibitor-like [Haliotis cracherodii]|uniref:four-domain proteases inhibitor-like n=1 Tax=Haliotis cracherodii TaxID=6455 RepID=UPI0039EB4EF5
MTLQRIILWMLISASVSEAGIFESVCQTVVLQLDCSSGHFPTKNICASDGINYATECLFSKAHCLNPSLKVTDGKCLTPSQSSQLTTQGPIATTPTSPVTLSAICQVLISATCPDLKEEVCGTDLETYDNMCTFEVAKCKMPSLNIKNRGACKPTAFDIICKTVINYSCPPETELVCGSDGKTYSNLCEFDKGKCGLPHLTISSIGKC